MTVLKPFLSYPKRFVSSGWCDFELQMAKVKSFDEGHDLVVIIMLEPVPAASIKSKTLQALIKTNTYLEWIPGDQHERQFWQRMKVLGQPKSVILNNV